MLRPPITSIMRNMVIKQLIKFLFIASFAFVLQKASGKAHTPKVARIKGSLREGAGAVGD